MRLLLVIAALAALVAYQRPDWVRGIDSGARRASEVLGDLRASLGLGPERGTIAALAKAEAPGRTAALTALDRVADARQPAPVGVQQDPAARERIQDLLRRAAVTLAGSEAMGELRSLQETRARLADLRERVAMARVAGSDATELETQAAQAAAEAARRLDAFIEALAGLGVRVSREAAETVAVSVNGDDVVALLAAYGNVERLEGELRAALSDAPDNEAVLRRCYGIHATLLAVLETVQAEAIARVDGVYLPRLESIEREVRTLREDARSRLRQTREAGLRTALEANLRTQDLTLRATDLYRRYLQDQRSGIAQALDRTRAALGVADNTARTATLALDVAAMMRSTERDFSALMAVRPPVVAPFEGDALRREFEGLSRRLGQQPTS
jgi:hypothetical protein